MNCMQRGRVFAPHTPEGPPPSAKIHNPPPLGRPEAPACVARVSSESFCPRPWVFDVEATHASLAASNSPDHGWRQTLSTATNNTPPSAIPSPQGCQYLEDLKIMQFNCNGLRNKLDEIVSYM
ncbi:hypothetical protein DMENIID0001_140020 [Sergentomyia squamirostris]